MSMHIHKTEGYLRFGKMSKTVGIFLEEQMTNTTQSSIEERSSLGTPVDR